VGGRLDGLPDVGRDLRAARGWLLHASIYSSPATGVNYVSGPISVAWAAQGWEAGIWGYPTSSPIPVGANVTQRFERGTATWNSTTGAVTFG
jgi:uncharacterized protein with LGFP repeats